MMSHRARRDAVGQNSESSAMWRRRQRQTWRRALTGCLMALAFAQATDAWSADVLSVEVCFTPGEDCTGQLVTLLDGAQREILVQAYSFTSAPIASALRDAHKRGVAVTVILDRSQRSEKYSSADFLAHAGIQTFIDAKHAIAHNKIMVIDGAILVTGSFNFTKAAQERNAENLLVIQGNRGLLQRYRKNFETHRAHAERYNGR